MTKLQREQEYCEIEIEGKKAELAEQVKQAIESDGLNAKNFLFSDDVYSTIISFAIISSDMTSMKNEFFSDMTFVYTPMLYRGI